jgi:Zn-dependent protease
LRSSIKLFDIFGIAIKIHFTFLLLPLIFGQRYGLRGIFLIIFVFCCVVFHELCHSLQAKHFGIRVDQIVLLPIGGIAAMKSIPEKPSQEFKISISGPLFNIVFALILFFPAYFLLGPDILANPGIDTWPQTLAYAFWINPILAIFNLLPAFPMDGGRVLRSFLANKMDYGKATRIAVAFGHTFAVLFGLLGLLSRPINPILIIIAFFIFMAASQEGMQVDIRMTLRKFLVKDVLPKQYVSINAYTPLSDVLALTLHTHQEDFPVVEADKLVGLLTRADIILAIHQFGMQRLTKDVMRKDFPTVQLNDSLMKAHHLMEEGQIKAIPVLNQTQIVGIVSLEHISRVYTLMSDRK